MIDNTQTIQWFPGHMAKTRRKIAEQLKLIDAVAEIVDKKVNEYFTDIWLKNPKTETTDNLATKVSELETVVNALVGGEE